MILNHHGIMGLKQKVRIGDKFYKCVKIGNQIWLAENLELPFANTSYYNDDPSQSYGLLYRGKDMGDLNDYLLDNNVGWHVPTESELQTLWKIAGGGPTDGAPLKSTTSWNTTPGTNALGFDAKAAGMKVGSIYQYKGSYFIAWSCSKDVSNPNNMIRLTIQDSNNTIYTNGVIDTTSVSVRLIKDTAPVTIGNKTYNTVKIGNQLWMMENLDYQFEGLNIGGETLQDDVHAWYFNNDPEQSEGLLYNGYAASYLAEHPELLPEGWRVPTQTDFYTLQTTVGGAVNAGLYLKKALPDTAWSTGFNSYRFYGIPSGLIRSNGVFDNRYNYLRLWTSTLGSETQQIFFNIQDNNNSSNVTSFANNRATAIPIRLVKQVPTSSTTLSSLSTAPSEE